jgi:7,8-dihydroneopterin aldolase/epimerase/oxygenase
MSTRRILFSRIALDASIGILEHERIATQPIHIDAAIDVDVHKHVDDDDIGSVLDYRALHHCIAQECTQGHVNLLETLTDKVANRLLGLFSEIREVQLRITKPSAFADCAGVAIEVTVRRDV